MGRREGPGPDDDADPRAMSIADARAAIASRLPRLAERERVASAEALGRVTARDVVAPTDVPRFRSAAMDGYALRHADADAPLRVVARSLAGHPSSDAFGRGECVRITTGARVPDDADTVVQQENAAREGDTVRVTARPARGLHVRPVGSDTRRGERLIGGNTRLAAPALALLAAHGLRELDVLRPLRLALFSSGDELVEPGGALPPGHIHDANRPLLTALLASPAVRVIDLGICPDTPRALDTALETAADVDLVVSSGGVSVGEADHVRGALARRGSVSLWKIAMKPGRPLTFGALDGGAVFFGLPGNPVSAALTASLFVLPAIATMLGLDGRPPPPLRARLVGDLAKRAGRVEYQRGRLAVDGEGEPVVETSGLQESYALRSLHEANCLIELPLASLGARDGETVIVHPFAHFAPAPLG